MLFSPDAVELPDEPATPFAELRQWDLSVGRVNGELQAWVLCAYIAKEFTNNHGLAIKARYISHSKLKLFLVVQRCRSIFLSTWEVMKKN